VFFSFPLGPVYSRAGHKKKMKAAERENGGCKSFLYLMMAVID
jgi:hypothetical protein